MNSKLLLKNGKTNLELDEIFLRKFKAEELEPRTYFEEKLELRV